MHCIQYGNDLHFSTVATVTADAIRIFVPVFRVGVPACPIDRPPGHPLHYTPVIGGAKWNSNFSAWGADLHLPGCRQSRTS
jgi:hypothetical protein